CLHDINYKKVIEGGSCGFVEKKNSYKYQTLLSNIYQTFNTFYLSFAILTIAM
uniref:Uncharacterized protein n=1 Tax=Ciona savignyi TaxID=51511 RepID=H2Z8U4_CIOSA